MKGPLYTAHRARGADFIEVGGRLTPRTFSDPANEYLALRREAGLCDLSHLGIVRATGPERVSFLQSILSQDLGQIEEPGRFTESLLLSPKGKIEFGLWVFSRDEEIVLVTEAGREADLVAALNHWRIRVKCELSEAPDLGLLELRGPLAASRPGHPLDWPLLPGRLSLQPVDRLERVWADLAASVRPVGWAAREAVRVEAGIPRIGPGLDADESTIPQEAFLDRTMVSFTKGCFLGQELVCRIDSRGHVNRHLRGLVVLDTVLPPVGAEIVSGGKTAGRLTSVAESLELRAPVCLGSVRREVEPPAAVMIRWEGGEARAEVRELPLV